MKPCHQSRQKTGGFRHARRLTAVFLFFLLTLCPFYLFAADAPDAGQLLREQVPQRPLPKPPPGPALPAERPPLVDDGLRITVKAIRFSGIEGLAQEEELQNVVKDAIGKAMGFRGFQALAERVTAYLKEKGYFLARAYLPQQDITDGVIDIAVILGRIEGELKIFRKEGVRLREGVIRRIFQSALPPEAPLREDRLERAMLLLNDLPGISARSYLEKGSAPGTSRLAVRVEEGPLFTGGLWGDNYGNRYTGDLRGSGILSLNDPIGIGDQFSLLVTGAERLEEGRASFSLPLMSNGLMGHVGLTAMNYRIGKELESLRASGYARMATAGFSYPVIRERTFNLGASLDYGFKILKDESLDTVIHDKRVHNGSFGLSGDSYDRILGGGYTTAGLTLTGGDLSLSRVPADQAADDAGPRSSGQYGRANLNLSRLQRLTERLGLLLSYSGQLATGNLDSGEKFILGGPYGVRAYPIGEASGDEGHLFSAEMRYAWPVSSIAGLLQMTVFGDAGYVTLHKTLWPGAISSATGENHYWLSGAGAGITLSKTARYLFRVVYAHRIGDNPGRSAAGKDADGLDDEGRFWLQGGVYF